MGEKSTHFRIAGEFLKIEDSEDDSEEEVFQAIFEEDNENSEASFESEETSQGLAFSLEIKTTENKEI